MQIQKTEAKLELQLPEAADFREELSQPPSAVIILSQQILGLEMREIRIECLKSKGLAQLQMVGLPDAWLKESREKIKSVVSQIGSWGSFDRLLVQLLPPELAKNGAHLELAIAIACLIALSGVNVEEYPELSKIFWVGSLGLDGSLIATEQSRWIENRNPIWAWGPQRFSTLADIWHYFLEKKRTPLPAISFKTPTPSKSVEKIPINGRYYERSALVLAIAAKLHIFMIGPPGAGKSHLARWAHSIAPQSSEDLSLIEHIWLLAGRGQPSIPPLVCPHSRTLLSEFLGSSRGGSQRPGLWAQAHHGVLILDEFSELNRDCRETLRTVLDQKKVLVSYKGQSLEWPADFQLIATSNPCECGYALGRDVSRCRCLIQNRSRYQQRISGPILDRFGLHLFVNADNRLDPKTGFLDSEKLDASPEKIQDWILDIRKHCASRLEFALNLLRSDSYFINLSTRTQIQKSQWLAAFLYACPNIPPERALQKLKELHRTAYSVFQSV